MSRRIIYQSDLDDQAAFEQKKFIKCECHAEGLEISYDGEFKTFDISLWSYGRDSRGNSFWQNLKNAWKLLCGNRPSTDEMMFSPDKAKQLADYIYSYLPSQEVPSQMSAEPLPAFFPHEPVYESQFEVVFAENPFLPKSESELLGEQVCSAQMPPLKGFSSEFGDFDPREFYIRFNCNVIDGKVQPLKTLLDGKISDVIVTQFNRAGEVFLSRQFKDVKVSSISGMENLDYSSDQIQSIYVTFTYTEVQNLLEG